MTQTACSSQAEGLCHGVLQTVVVEQAFSLFSEGAAAANYSDFFPSTAGAALGAAGVTLLGAAPSFNNPVINVRR